jgi:type IX secretion system PorP/SprF family membrane protein
MVVCTKGIGQQRPGFTQFMLNKYYDNPAYGGLEKSLSIFTSFRDQNSSFPGNPQTFYAGADMPFYLWNGAIGLSMYNQKFGVFSNSNIRFSYNYVIGLNFGFLSFGGRLGLDFLNFDGKKIITPDGDYDDTFTHNDPFIDENAVNGFGPSWEMGTYFMGSNVQAGLTISELPSHKYKIGQGTYNRSMSGTLYGSYKYEWSDQLEFSSHVQVRIDPAAIQSDVGLIANINRNLLLGLNFRGYNTNSIDALSVIMGTNLGQKYKLYYSYDFGLSELRTYHQGSHEVMLSYNLQKLIGIGLPPKIIYNPRDL